MTYHPGQFSKDFHLRDLVKSYKATTERILEQFYPPDDIIDRMELMCRNLLQPLRDHLVSKFPSGRLSVSSGYRCPRLNSLVGGAEYSQHMRGEAADVEFYIGDTEHNEEIVDAMIETKLQFDQMIEEKGWVHLSYTRNGNRNQHLKQT